MQWVKDCIQCPILSDLTMWTYRRNKLSNVNRLRLCWSNSVNRLKMQPSTWWSIWKSNLLSHCFRCRRPALLKLLISINSIDWPHHQCAVSFNNGKCLGVGDGNGFCLVAIQLLENTTPAPLQTKHVTKILVTSLPVFFKNGQLDSSSISDHLTLTFPKNFLLSWWMGGRESHGLSPKGRERRNQ